MLKTVAVNPFHDAAEAGASLLEHTPRREFSVLISGRNRKGLDRMVRAIEVVADVAIRTNHVRNGHSDPLHGSETLPDLLVLWISDQWRDELAELIKRPIQQRPALIVIGDISEQEAMRMAMKAGAMDYLRQDFEPRELQSAVAEILDSSRGKLADGIGSLVSVVNAKGGSGGSIIACNLAHALCDRLEQKVALVDLDLQFGSLCHYLDLEPKYGIVEVLQNIYELDQVALEGYMLKHSSGLKILDVKPGSNPGPSGLSAGHIDALLDLLISGYGQVVVDVPRSLGSLSRSVLLKSDRIIVVLQQSISHLRDAKRLLDVLRKDWGIEQQRIMVVINRFDKHADLGVSDIAKAVGQEVSCTIPNAFAQVNAAVNEGVPLSLLAKKSAVNRAMLELGERVLGRDGSGSRRNAGIMTRILKNLKGA